MPDSFMQEHKWVGIILFSLSDLESIVHNYQPFVCVSLKYGLVGSEMCIRDRI